MSRKKNVYNQAKRGAKRYKKAKAGKKGRAVIFAVAAVILAAVGISQKDIGRLEQAADKILDAYETVAGTAGASGENGTGNGNSGTSGAESSTTAASGNESSANVGSENSASSGNADSSSDGTTVAVSGEGSGYGTAPAGTEIGAGAEVYVDLSAVPPYSGAPYVEVNGNVPYFTETDLTSESFEYYSDLDELGRCGTAYSSVGTDLMPTEKRGSISKVKPTGWQTAKYDFVDGKYLYNRCHLIGYQLTAENANAKNLITGTRYLNVDGMLPFENLVADYVKETENHVLYRVTPVFDGDNLVASGVLMEAESVEDDGDGVEYCVYVYNVQPGVEIDYATGDNHAA